MEITCLTCERVFRRRFTNGRKPIRCPECAAAHNRKRCRDHNRLTYVPSSSHGPRTFDCQCKVCGETFSAGGPHAAYCSKTCRNIGRKKAVGTHSKTCPMCSREFKSVTRRQKHCSTECAHLAHRRRVTLKCANPQCGKDFDKCQAQAANGRKFCSWECFQAVHGADLCTCQGCGKLFKAKSYKYEWQGKNKYCSKDCYYDHRFGANRPGKTSSPAVIDRACRRSLATSLRKRCKVYGVPFDPACTREAVCERDGWICQECGVKCHKGRHRFNKRTRKMSRRNAEHDHIVPLSRRNPSKGNTFDNSQCLCRVCNGRKHARGGGQMRFALAGC